MKNDAWLQKLRGLQSKLVHCGREIQANKCLFLIEFMISKQLQAVVLLLTGCVRTCGTYFTTAVPTHKITMWQLKISYFYHFLGGSVGAFYSAMVYYGCPVAPAKNRAS